MKVLVLGGTGAIGTHVVRRLSDGGHKVVVTSRASRKGEGNITYWQGNAREIAFAKELFQEHWDAIVDFMVYTTEEFEERVKLILSSTKQYPHHKSRFSDPGNSRSRRMAAFSVDAR